VNTLPAWLAARSPAAGPCATGGPRLRAGFAERTLLTVAAFTGDALRQDEEARRPGLLQRLDARAKVASCVALLVGVALAHTLAALMGVAAGAFALAVATRLDPGRFLLRVWGVVPLFTAAVAVPAALNVVTPGPALVDLGPTPHALVALGWPARLALTGPGATAALRLILRTGASLSLVSLVARTTPPGEALRALRALGAPRAFVIVAAVAHRYLSLLVTTVEELHLALLSRRLRPLGGAEGRAFVASRVAFVLRKTRATADAVHEAMVARGFAGELRTLAEPRIGAWDLLATGVALGLALLLAFAGRATP
jgi:energy-coupling factor transporter transmembrane protein EcfT